MSTKLNPVFQTETGSEDKGMYLREGSDYYDLDGIENKNVQMTHDELVAAKELMMSGTSSENPLVNRDFVNSSISHMAANPRGNWATWSVVPTDPTQYPADADGNKKPTNNDYMVVSDMTGYSNPEEPSRTYEGTWRFTYIGEWDDPIPGGTRGKLGWKPIYQVNEKPSTQAQVDALNSGATSAKITSYDAHLLNQNNPHNVTKTLIGLGNVDNTSDANKPVSTAQQTELDKKVNIAQGVANANKFLKTDSTGAVICDTLAQGINNIEVVDELPATTVATTLYLIRETT